MRIFLSYSTPDHAAADTLRRALAARRPDLDLYFAPRRNDAGAYWIPRLGTELSEADAVLLLLGRRVGPWQELEYYEALRRNRTMGRPLITPVLLGDAAPGLPFLDQFHHLLHDGRDTDTLIGLVLQALDGVRIADGVPPWRLVDPYRGLRAMQTQDAAFFFGREALTGRILDRLADEPGRLQALVGNSGVGKSSVAMAGVLAALKSRLWPGDVDHPWPPALDASPGWPVVIVRPGDRPVKALARACAGLWLDSPAAVETEALQWQRLLMGDSSLPALLDATVEQLGRRAGADPPERAVLYVDQAEELYTRSDADEARHFSALVADAVQTPRLLVLLSLRSDHYGSFQADAPLFGAASTTDVTPLGRAAIEQVIWRPAEQLGVRFEPPDIVAHVADAAAREPGALPLLSDLLADAWRAMARDERSDGVLHLPLNLVDLGRPLAEKAERFLALHKEHEDTLRRLFTLKLALMAKAGGVVRRRTRRDECSNDEWALVDALAGGDWRLLTTGDDAGTPFAEVAHEALLRHWPRAARWLEDSREFLVWRGRFETECRDWMLAQGADHSRALLTGLRFDAAARWAGERPNDLTPDEHAFIDASRQAAAEREQRERQAAARLARQRKWIQRLSTAALVVVAAVAVVALWQGRKARLAEGTAMAEGQKAIDALADARRQAALADARRLAMAAETVLDDGVGATTLAGLLAVESLRSSATLEGQRVLRRVLSLLPRNAAPIATPWSFADVHPSPDGRLVAFSRLKSDGTSTGPAAGAVAVIDARSWQQRALLPQDGRAWPVLSANGRWMAVAGYGRRLQVFDQADGRRRLDIHQDDMFDAVFDAQGERLFVARTDGAIEVRHAPDWQLVSTLRFPVDGERRNSVLIDIDAHDRVLLVHGQTAREARLNPWLVPIDGGTPIALGDKRADLARFGPAGDTVVTVTWDAEIAAWDTANGQKRFAFKPESPVADIAVSPDGRTLAVATRSGEVQLADADTGQVRRTLSHPRWVNAVAFSPDGTRLATGSDDHSAAVWSLATGERLVLVTHGDEVWSVAFSADGTTLLSGSGSGELQVTDVASGTPRRRVDFDGGIHAIALRPGSDTVAVAVRGTTQDQAWTDVQLADRAKLTEVARIEHNGQLRALRFSPDGATLATAGVDSDEVKLWDTATGRLKAQAGVAASSLRFSPDGRRLVAGAVHREAVVLDAADGRRLATIGEPGGVEAVAFAADRRTAITFGQDGRFKGWDAVRGTLLWSRPAGWPDVRGVKFSGDGHRFATSAADGIEVGNARTGRILATVQADRGANYFLSDDGGTLILARTGLTDPQQPGRRSSTVELVQADTGRRIAMRQLAHGMARVEILPGAAIAVIAMPERLARGRVEVIDTRSGATRWSAETGFGYTWVNRVAGRDDVMAIGASGTGEATELRRIDNGQALTRQSGRLLGAVSAASAGGLVAALGEGSVELRDVRTGAVQRRLDGLEGVRDVLPGTDGRCWFARVNSDDRTGVWTWRTDDPSPPRYIAMDNAPRRLVPLADPDLLAVYDNADSLRVWRVSTGEEVHRMSHTLTAVGIATADAADRVVTWRGASVRVWNTRDGSQVAHRLSHGAIQHLSVSPDGRTVAYVTGRARTARRGSNFEALALWEPEGRDAPEVLPMAAPGALRFGPRGERLAVVRGSTAVQLIDVATLRSSTLVEALPGGRIGEIAFSADGRLLLATESARQRSALRVVDLGSGAEIARVDGRATLTPVSTPPDGTAPTVPVRDAQWRWRNVDIRSAAPDSTLWHGTGVKARVEHRAARLLLSAEKPGSLDIPDRLRSSLTVAPVVDGAPLNVWEIDADGGRLAVVTDDGISIHAADDGRRLADWPGAKLGGAGQYVGPHSRPVRGLLFADRGRLLVAFDAHNAFAADASGRLWLWRWQEGAPRQLSDKVPINRVAVSPDGELIASAEGRQFRDPDTDRWHRLAEARIRLWNARTGEEVRALSMEGDVDAVAFSPDGKRLAARTARGVVVFGTDDGSPDARFEFEGQRTGGGSVRFALDGRRIVAETAGGVHVWPLDGSPGMLLRHGTDFPRYRLSADGRLLVTFDRTLLRVWDLQTGSARFDMSYPDRKYVDFALLGNDETLFALTRDGVDRVLWRPDRLIAEACRRYDRDFETEEWTRFLAPEVPRETCTSPGR